MKLCAIRLAEFRKFSDPVVIEGFSGGLDMLAAPNEDGKSTIFDAVRLVLTEKYSAGGRKIEAMQPYIGGAPSVEIDFELDGRLYRLRKRFAKSKDAWLSDLTKDREIARKDDVEDWLSEHVTKRAPGGLFWVDQGESLRPVMVRRDTSKAEDDRITSQSARLRAIIEGEVGAVFGGERFDAVRGDVARRLGELVSTRGPRAEFKAAIDRRDGLARDLEAARSRMAEAEDRLQRLDEIANERREPGAAGDDRLAARLAGASQALDEARKAADELARSHNKLAAAEAKRDAAAERLERFDTEADEFENLRAEIANRERERETSEATLAEAEAALEAGNKAGEELEARRAQLNTALKLVGYGESIGRIDEQLEMADVITARIAEFESELGDIGVSAEGLAALGRAERAIQALEARLALNVPHLTMHYEGGAGRRVRAAGAEIVAGARFAIEGPTEFEIDGVGTMSIEPGGSQSIEEDRLALAQDRAERARSLAAMKVSDSAEAEALLERRRDLEGRIRTERARLEMIAPRGREALGAERNHLEDLCRELAGVVEPETDRGVVETGLRRLETEATTLREEIARRQTVRDEAWAQRVDQDARLKARRARLAELAERGLGDEAGRATARAALARELENAAGAVNGLLREQAAWREAAPDDARMQVLEERYAGAVAAGEERRRRLGVLAEEAARIEGELGEVFREGLGERLESLAGECEAAEAVVVGIEREVAALRMLERVLGEVASETRAAYFRPVAERLEPYFGLLFPGARVSFDDGFSVAGLLRDDRIEDLDALSHGTREQIGILVRLGFARLFADRGCDIPLILDDALVYSDDERIARAFAALRLAAEHHQVIVLTCRADAFQPLGAKRVEIKRG